MLIRFIKSRIHKRKEEVRQKKALIRRALVDYYETINQTKVNLPAFIYAERTMRKLIKNRKDLDYYYQGLKEFYGKKGV